MANNYRQKNFDRSEPEFDQKMIDLRRVARVVAGGRRFSFRATLVVGNRKGEVGVGTAKASDTAAAIQKAYRQAIKNTIKIALTDKGSIAHDIYGKFASAKVLIRPSVEGHGLVAGSSVRTVLDFAGVKNASAKILSHSKNKISNAQAALKALGALK
ncbi:MAG: 30S ribosomal protein S5 [Candidatus Niyogibacteria bacterium]|nr:30S ribosomal protein S5 [Candidatus Niyogibacteria bacterium]